jgi:hypothetical protein
VNLFRRVSGQDGVQSGHKDAYQFGLNVSTQCMIRLVLPCTGVLVVGVTSVRERERIPSLLRVCEQVCSVSCSIDLLLFEFDSPFLGVVLAFPFIVSKERAQVIIMVNGKRGKR